MASTLCLKIKIIENKIICVNHKSCRKGPLSCYPVKGRVHGLRRPTATGSDITSDKNQGADLNITLIAEQIGRSPATEAEKRVQMLFRTRVRIRGELHSL